MEPMMGKSVKKMTTLALMVGLLAACSAREDQTRQVVFDNAARIDQGAFNGQTNPYNSGTFGGGTTTPKTHTTGTPQVDLSDKETASGSVLDILRGEAGASQKDQDKLKNLLAGDKDFNHTTFGPLGTRFDFSCTKGKEGKEGKVNVKNKKARGNQVRRTRYKWRKGRKGKPGHCTLVERKPVKGLVAGQIAEVPYALDSEGEVLTHEVMPYYQNICLLRQQTKTVITQDLQTVVENVKNKGRKGRFDVVTYVVGTDQKTVTISTMKCEPKLFSEEYLYSGLFNPTYYDVLMESSFPKEKSDTPEFALQIRTGLVNTRGEMFPLSGLRFAVTTAEGSNDVPTTFCRIKGGKSLSDLVHDLESKEELSDITVKCKRNKTYALDESITPVTHDDGRFSAAITKEEITAALQQYLELKNPSV